jgi:hypothetical protein
MRLPHPVKTTGFAMTGVELRLPRQSSIVSQESPGGDALRWVAYVGEQRDTHEMRAGASYMIPSF